MNLSGAYLSLKHLYGIARYSEVACAGCPVPCGLRARIQGSDEGRTGRYEGYDTTVWRVAEQGCVAAIRSWSGRLDEETQG